ncbi:hypothetical protein DFH08DRAFT_825914 [Mycena albidolilacea]|uniref:Uncharacterized protein n=1 Tax=Mycena albidolilacea TaxID=1033008 RepID=A0AAD6Z1D3_9AGAR|nr:hypothetical protein DFH08DRAFT_825914 [Mycena albidolilacea]
MTLCISMLSQLRKLGKKLLFRSFTNSVPTCASTYLELWSRWGRGRILNSETPYWPGNTDRFEIHQLDGQISTQAQGPGAWHSDVAIVESGTKAEGWNKHQCECEYEAYEEYWFWRTGVGENGRAEKKKNLAGSQSSAKCLKGQHMVNNGKIRKSSNRINVPEVKRNCLRVELTEHPGKSSDRLDVPEFNSRNIPENLAIGWMYMTLQFGNSQAIHVEGAAKVIDPEGCTWSISQSQLCLSPFLHPFFPSTSLPSSKYFPTHIPTTTMGQKRKFNAEQNKHIESFFPDFVKKLDNGVPSGELTLWKQNTAPNILDSPLFESLDLQTMTRKEYYERIVRKLTNCRNQLYDKAHKREGSPPKPLNLKKANPWLKFSTLMTGRQLFVEETHETTILLSKQRALDTGPSSPAALYQNILKERWDALSAEEQATWNKRAEADAGDVEKNPAEFTDVLSLSLQHLCQSNLLGDAEMVLFYAFCEPNHGDIRAGTCSIGCLWHIARFMRGLSTTPSDLSVTIPRNSARLPVFPSIDINLVAMADIRLLLVHYFDECWGEVFVPINQARPSNYHGFDIPGSQQTEKLIPWAKIVSHPEKYYKVLNLAQDLRDKSGLDSPNLFCFLAPEKFLVPDSPSTHPSPLPQRAVIVLPPQTLPPEIPVVSSPLPSSSTPPPKDLVVGSLRPMPSPPPKDTLSSSKKRKRKGKDPKEGPAEWDPETESQGPKQRRRSLRKLHAAETGSKSSNPAKKQRKYPGWVEFDSDGQGI